MFYKQQMTKYLEFLDQKEMIALSFTNLSPKIKVISSENFFGFRMSSPAIKPHQLINGPWDYVLLQNK